MTAKTAMSLFVLCFVISVCGGHITLAIAGQSFDASCLKEMQDPNRLNLHENLQFDRQCLLGQLTPYCAKLFGTAAMSSDPICRNETIKASERCVPEMMARKRETLKRNLSPSCWKQFEANELELERLRKR